MKCNDTSNLVIDILQACCGENRELYDQLCNQIRQSLITEEHCGDCYVDTAAVLHLAFRLTCSDYAGAMVKRKDAYRLLKEGTRDHALLDKMLGKKGSSFSVSGMPYPPEQSKQTKAKRR